jgi:CHASE2 domain-containing sensor protein
MKCYLISVFVLLNFSCGSQDVRGSWRAEEKIVLVNVDSLSRKEIAELLIMLDVLSPKVVGVDVLFKNYETNSEDTVFYAALPTCKNLVLARSLDYSGGDSALTFKKVPVEFLPDNAYYGFVNGMPDIDNVLTGRFFIRKIVDRKIFYHLSVQVAMLYDSEKTCKFIESRLSSHSSAQHNTYAILEDYTQRPKFKIIPSLGVLKGETKADDVRDKIVLIGYLGPKNEDKFSTIYSKRSIEPDIYGVEILGHICAQILEEK